MSNSIPLNHNQQLCLSCAYLSKLAYYDPNQIPWTNMAFTMTWVVTMT